MNITPFNLAAQYFRMIFSRSHIYLAKGVSGWVCTSDHIGEVGNYHSVD